MIANALSTDAHMTDKLKELQNDLRREYCGLHHFDPLERQTSEDTYDLFMICRHCGKMIRVTPDGAVDLGEPKK